MPLHHFKLRAYLSLFKRPSDISLRPLTILHLNLGCRRGIRSMLRLMPREIMCVVVHRLRILPRRRRQQVKQLIVISKKERKKGVNKLERRDSRRNESQPGN